MLSFNRVREKILSLKTPFLVVSFFLIAPLTVIAFIISLFAIDKTYPRKESVDSKTNYNLFDVPRRGIQVYAALPDTFPSISGYVESGDSKKAIIKNYLLKNKSALAPYSDLIVEAALKFGIDYRLTTAIAQKESGLCKVIPEDSYNCWGWGIHSKGSLKFESYQEGVEIVSKGLKENYIEKGYVTVDEIMKKYASPTSTTWADGVLQYMQNIEDI